LGYKIFLSAPPAPAPIVNADGSTEAAPVEGQDILDLVAKLDAITVDQSFFSSTLFMSLIDFKIPLRPEAQGRDNPFANFGAASSKTAVTTKLPS
jgi:hypothetical protein